MRTKSTDRIRLAANLKDNPTDVTWKSYTDVLTIKLMNSDVDLSLDLGPDVIRQLRQALSWQSLTPIANSLYSQGEKV